MLPSRDTVAFCDQLSTGIGLLDAGLRFVHANPAFVQITGLNRWRGCLLGALGSSVDALSKPIERVRATDSALTLRGWNLMSREPPLRLDATLNTWGGDGLLLELHAPAHPDADALPKISQTLRGLAHEINNPLAGLRGAAQLLKRRLPDPELTRLADLILAEADRLGTLTGRLLHPGGKPHLSAVNLHEVAERARALIAAEAPPALKLDRDYDPSLPTFRGDADRLLQLLLNLMRNAMQANAKRILVRTRAEHGVLVGNQPVRLAVRLDVIDDGDGVPESLRDSLFMPLVPGRPGGTGLGLALAQEIAQEHAGQIAHLVRTEGTTFALTLPLHTNHD